MAKWRRLGNSLKLKIYLYLANKEDVARDQGADRRGRTDELSADDFFPSFDTGNQNPLPAYVQYPTTRILLLRNPTVLDPMKALDDRAYRVTSAPTPTESTFRWRLRTGFGRTRRRSRQESVEMYGGGLPEGQSAARRLPDVIAPTPKPCSTWLKPMSGTGRGEGYDAGDAAYRKGIEASCVYNGVAAARPRPSQPACRRSRRSAERRKRSKPSLRQRYRDDDAPARGMVEQRRTGYRIGGSGIDPQLLSGIMHRWPYPEREGSVNDNVPHVDGYGPRCGSKTNAATAIAGAGNRIPASLHFRAPEKISFLFLFSPKAYLRPDIPQGVPYFQAEIIPIERRRVMPRRDA